MTEAEKYLELFNQPKDETYGLFQRKSDNKIFGWDEFLTMFKDEQIKKALEEQEFINYFANQNNIEKAIEEIEKSLPSDNEFYEAYLNDIEPSAMQVRNKIQAAINKLKKG